jgi:hypothetical protein
MKHSRSLDLAQEDMLDHNTGLIGGFTVMELVQAARALQHLRFAHLSPAWSYDAQCCACGHIKTIDRWEFERQVGAQALFVETQRRLRCSKCGTRGASTFRLKRMLR